MRATSPQNERGFTLVELSVVLLLIGLLASLVFPAIPHFTEEGIKASARELKSFLRGVFATTITRGEPMRIKVDIEDNKLFLQICEFQGEGLCEWKESGKEIKIGYGVDISSLRVGGEEFSSGEVFIPISANTGGAPFSILLKKSKDYFTVFYNSFTGEVEIYEGDKEVIFYEME